MESGKKVVVVPSSVNIDEYLADVEQGRAVKHLRTKFDAPSQEEMGCNDAYDADKGEDPD
jgi:hypothetical protein